MSASAGMLLTDRVRRNGLPYAVNPSCVACMLLQEEVRDLLWTNSSAPRPVVTIRELPTGVSLAGACERQVSTREEMSHVLMQGTLMRAVAATNMNNRCARVEPAACAAGLFTGCWGKRMANCMRMCSCSQVSLLLHVQ